MPVAGILETIRMASPAADSGGLRVHRGVSPTPSARPRIKATGDATNNQAHGASGLRPESIRGLIGSG